MGKNSTNSYFLSSLENLEINQFPCSLSYGIICPSSFNPPLSSSTPTLEKSENEEDTREAFLLLNLKEL